MVRGFHRDHAAGLLIGFLGLGVLLQARSYDLGTLAHVGPGFLPMILGVLLTGIGALIGLGAGSDEEAGPIGGHGHGHAGPSARGWVCIVASVLLFVGLAQYAGLAPAIFACVFVAALGDGNARPVSSLLLAAGMTAFGILVFHYGLGVQLPVIRGF